MRNVLTSVLGMGDATLNKVRDSVVLFWFAMCSHCYYRACLYDGDLLSKM